MTGAMSLLQMNWIFEDESSCSRMQMFVAWTLQPFLTQHSDGQGVAMPDGWAVTDAEAK